MNLFQIAVNVRNNITATIILTFKLGALVLTAEIVVKHSTEFSNLFFPVSKINICPTADEFNSSLLNHCTIKLGFCFKFH